MPTLLGLPKSLFMFHCTILEKNSNNFFGQPNTCAYMNMCV